MPDQIFWNSDFIKIGIPSTIAVIATFIAYKKDIHLNATKIKHERSMLILETDIKSIDDISNTMGVYYEAWSDVLSSQSRLLGQSPTSTEKIWEDISTQWGAFSDLSSIQSKAASKLHILGAQDALDVFIGQRELYKAHWEVLEKRKIMSHEELIHLGDNIAAYRNDFYRSLRIARKQLENNT